MKGKIILNEHNNIKKLARDFNVLRRSVTTYPARHPVAEQALARAHATLSEIINISGSLVIGIAKNVLIAGEETIELKDAAVREFAETLYSLGIVSVTFSQPCGVEELRLLNECFATKPDSAADQSGIRRIFDNARFEHISVRTIDYGAFSVQSGIQDNAGTEQANFWERFVRGVLAGTITAASSGGPDAKLLEEATPEMLAELFQDRIVQDSGGALSAMLGLLRNYMKLLDQDALISDPPALTKFISFLQSLKSETRNLFLHTAMDALAIHPEVAEGLFDNFTGDMISDLLNNETKADGYAPPVILNILLRLAKRRGISLPAGLPGGDETGEDPLKHKLQVIFREDKKNTFVSEDHNTLHAMLAGSTPEYDEEKGIGELVKTLSDHELEVQISNIIIELLDLPLVGLHNDADLSRNLLDSCGYFLRTGDFVTLARIFDRAQRLQQAGDCRLALLKVFTEADFISEVLRGPAMWGKEKFGDIAGLIRRIGEPAIDPLLDSLADEQKASVRRFYMDMITDFGTAAISRVGARIDDHRWYFVRNLVVILRKIDSPEIIPVLRSLQKHQNTKVLLEVQRTLLQIKDAGGLVLLAKSLDSADPFARIDAIRLAAQYNNPDIIHKLESVVDEGGFSEDEVEIKKAAVRSLATIGAVSCLPFFEKILKKKPFLSQAGLRPLQEEIIAALISFPSPEARDLLGHVREFGSRHLRQKAEEIANSRGQKL